MKYMKTTIYSIHILAAFLAAMFLSACGGSSNSPEGVARKFFTALQNQDVKTATACSSKAKPGTSQADKSMIIAILTAAMQDELQKNGGIEAMETSPVSDSGDKAEVEVKITYKNGKTDESPCKMVKENGAWKVDDVGR